MLDPVALEQIRSLAPAYTAVVATFALIIATAQVIINRRIQIDTRVKNLYYKFIEKSADWAEVSSPLDHKFDWQNQKLNNCSKKFKQYLWYVSFMLDVCEEIFYTNKDRSFVDTIGYQIRLHKEALTSDFFRQKNLISMYRPEFKAFIERNLIDAREPGFA